MKTTSFNPKKVSINWHIIDANNQILGRVASRIAQILTGKNKVEFTPNQVISDKVVVINASKLKVTGNKAQDKIYYTHSNYPGGLKAQSYEKRMSKNPSKVLVDAVRGMLPINRLRDRRIVNLYVYEGETHPHGGQVK
ncbi:50S ribosomal protein L13 [bacterium]|jgi:large subunit ribosomal protein L13|nr:50S ribosomal protein L13 [bacterium]